MRINFMKKSGFTLAELLLVIGIIGVISAITVPMLGSVMPDKNKVKVLKTYKVINDITQELLNDPGIYECPKLSCAEASVREGFDHIKGKGKFSYYFTQKIDKTESYEGGSDESNFKTHKFSTNDGTYWDIHVSNIDGSVEILINVDGKTAQDSGKSCFYSSTCTKPNQFKFTVDDFGHVLGYDPLTRAYIANPDKLNDKKNDLETAKNDKFVQKAVIPSKNSYEAWLDREKRLNENIVRIE